jgi:hypothetical protein
MLHTSLHALLIFRVTLRRVANGVEVTIEVD